MTDREKAFWIAGHFKGRWDEIRKQAARLNVDTDLVLKVNTEMSFTNSESK